MSKVSIDINSKYPAPETFTKIKSLFGENSEIKKFDPQMTCTFDEAGMSATAKGSKVNADMKVAPQGQGSTVSVSIDVPFLLSAFKGQIKSTVEKKLAALLG